MLVRQKRVAAVLPIKKRFQRRVIQSPVSLVDRNEKLHGLGMVAAGMRESSR